jgi:hypothetical protein
MSTMLEQAIIDAAALKDAAIKNAEQALIERYSVDIKDAVGLMLEQPMGGAMPAGLDAAPPAHGDGERLCPCPEDMEPVTLDFEELRVAMDAAEEAGEEDALGGMEGGEDELGMGGEDDLGLGGEEDEEEDLSDLLQEDGNTELEIELDESDISALMDAIKEELAVDVEPVPDGYSTSNRADDEEQLAQAMASARDGERAKERKDFMSRIKDLEEKVNALADSRTSLVQENKNLTATIDDMGQRMLKVNLANAKLLYTNRVLNSDSLNERQKKKIVEAISKVGSVEEAKTIFETLRSTVGSTDGKSNGRNTLSEAANRNRSSVPFMSRRKVVTESTKHDPALERMRRLAGIKKK